MPRCTHTDASARAGSAGNLHTARGPSQVLAAAIAGAALSLCCCASASATTYFRSAATAETGNGATSITVNAPAGVLAGDVMIATIDAEGSGSFTVPSGWSSTGLYSGTAFFGFSGVYFKVATSGEPASYTWGLGALRKATAKISDYVGVDNSSPIEVTPAPTAGAGFGTSDSTAGLTTTVNSTIVILDFGASDSAGSFTITPPASTSARASVFTSGIGSVLGGKAQDFVQASAGATPASAYGTSASIPWGEITIALRPAASGALGFDVAPQTPTLPTVALSGQAQSAEAKMSSFAVDDTTGSGSGWNVTVSGNAAAGKSAVFKEYCANGSEPCGSTAANSYAAGGFQLAPGSLKLITTGASWSTAGGTGTAPEFTCSSPSPACPLDASSPTKIASAPSGGGLGPWSAGGFGATSLKLSIPSTVRALSEHEVYRVDLLWTLATGP